MAGSSRMPRPSGPGSGRNRPSLPGSPSQRGQRPNLTPPPVVAPPPAVAPRGNTGRLKAPEVAPPPPVVAPPPAARPAGNTARMSKPAPTQPPAPAKRSTRQVAPATQPPASAKASTRQVAPATQPPAPAKASTRQVAPATQPPAPVAVSALKAAQATQPPAPAAISARKAAPTKQSPPPVATPGIKPTPVQPPEKPVDESPLEEIPDEGEAKPARKKLGTFKPLKPGGERPPLKLALQPESDGKTKFVLIGIAVVLALLVGGGIVLSMISGPAALIADDQWAQQSVPEGGFSVLLPKGEPLKRQMAAQGFNATEHSLTISHSALTFIVRHGAFDGAAPEAGIVYEALVGSLARMPGVSKKGDLRQAAIAGIDGREQELASSTHTMVARMAVHEGRYYLLVAEFRGTSRPAEADKFFASFKVGVAPEPSAE